MLIIYIGNWVEVTQHSGVGINDPKDERWQVAHAEGLLSVGGWAAIRDALADHLGAPPSELEAALVRAVEVRAHPFVRDAWHGAAGPLRDVIDPITIEEFDALVEAERVKEAGRLAKREYTRLRRAEFEAVRNDLVLAMLDSGTPYRCSHPGCAVSLRLTIDHINPLSRGGTDALGNLQFMCLPHNAAKGDRTPE